MHDHCWSFLPDQNVTTLYRGGAKRFEFLAKGVTRLKDIPEKFPLTSSGYDHLEIQDETMASLAFLRATFGDVPEAGRQKVRGELERYRGQDTEDMVWIVDALLRLAG